MSKMLDISVLSKLPLLSLGNSIQTLRSLNIDVTDPNLMDILSEALINVKSKAVFEVEDKSVYFCRRKIDSRKYFGFSIIFGGAHLPVIVFSSTLSEYIGYDKEFYTGNILLSNGDLFRFNKETGDLSIIHNTSGLLQFVRWDRKSISEANRNAFRYYKLGEPELDLDTLPILRLNLRDYQDSNFWIMILNRFLEDNFIFGGDDSDK